MKSSQPDKIGRYRLEEELELFGLGAYWRGKDVLTAEPVLVQVISFARLCSSKERSELFRTLSEGHRQSMEVAHAHVRSVLGVSRTAELLFVFHQWRDGSSLATLLGKQPRPYTPEQAAGLLGNLASALEAGHVLGLAHGRLNPLTVGLGESGAYLTDFGVAPILLDAGDRVLGTLSFPEFLAPEQVSGQKTEPVSDGYALGVLAYLLLTGALPFQAESQEELLDAILYHEPLEPRELEPALHPNTSRILLKALSKDPQNRFQSPTLFVTSLAKTLLEEYGPLPESQSKPAPIKAPASKRRWLQTLRGGSRHLLGLAEGETLGRQERTVYLGISLALLLLAFGWLFYLARPLSRVSEKIRQGELEEANLLLSHLGSRWEGDPELKIVSGELNFRLRRIDEAIQDLTEAFQADREELREAGLEEVLIRLHFDRPANPAAQLLACEGLRWATWPEILSRLGLGTAPRASRFLELLQSCGRRQELDEFASQLAARLNHTSDAALADALEPLAPKVRSVELDRAIALAYLRQARLENAAAALRRTFVLDHSKQAVELIRDELFRAWEKAPRDSALKAFLVEWCPAFETDLEQRLQHPDPVVRIRAWRVLEAAGRSFAVPISVRLDWQIEEAKRLGDSPGLEELVSSLRAQVETLPPDLRFLLAQYFLWRRDFESCRASLNALLEVEPAMSLNADVQGIFLIILAQGAAPRAWLESAPIAVIHQLLELASVAPDPMLREKAGQIGLELGQPGIPVERLVVELRDPSKTDVLSYGRLLMQSRAPLARAALASRASTLEDPWLRQRLLELRDK